MANELKKLPWPAYCYHEKTVIERSWLARARSAQTGLCGILDILIKDIGEMSDDEEESKLSDYSRHALLMAADECAMAVAFFLEKAEDMPKYGTSAGAKGGAA